MVWVAIAVGGALGAMARHAANASLHRFWSSGAVPVGIFVVNALGCFAIGVIAGLLASARVHMGEVGRTFVIVGVLGSFTTFSSYSLDTYTLLRGGHPYLALVNAGGQVVAGLAALWVGFALGSWRS
jgi:CrcB protein